MELKFNPVINSDFPDPDIIRVGDTYYMASTTMHYMPGCDILRSYDLMNWELIAHGYDMLDPTPGRCLTGNKNIYGKGMWAPTLRYHKGKFYICFAANDTHNTYLLTAVDPQGPWEKTYVEGFYYDSSLFFDDDDRIYILHGQKVLKLTELNKELSGPEPGGLDRVIIEDVDQVYVGYEGSHMYKYKGKYYVFTCHFLKSGFHRKTEDCFTADTLEGNFIGKCIIDDDMNYHNLGVGQGGMIDTPEGQWFAFMFQDRGALGRAPVMMPMQFRDDYPVIGKDGRIEQSVSIPSMRPDYKYAPLNGDDDFIYEPDEQGRIRLKLFWQFNHIPVEHLWSVTERKGALRIKSGKICSNIGQTYNILTQRSIGPESAAYVTLDGTHLEDGDYAGISAFQGCYGLIALVKNEGKYYLVMLGKPAKDETVYGDFSYEEPGTEYARILWNSPVAKLRVHADFCDKKDEAAFYYRDKEDWLQLGINQKLYFKMDHFTGCRFGLFLFSTKKSGGYADFLNFRFEFLETDHY